VSFAFRWMVTLPVRPPGMLGRGKDETLSVSMSASEGVKVAMGDSSVRSLRLRKVTVRSKLWPARMGEDSSLRLTWTDGCGLTGAGSALGSSYSVASRTAISAVSNSPPTPAITRKLFPLPL